MVLLPAKIKVTLRYASCCQSYLLPCAQNENELFNAIIWEISKTSYVSLSLLQLGVFDAVANFNGGRTASILIYEYMNYTLFWGVMG